MHSRQRGAAHVPIMFFLILMVLFFGALGFAYVQLTQNTDLRARNASAVEAQRKAEQKALLFTHYVEDLGKVVNNPGNYQARANVNVADDYGSQTLEGIGGVIDQNALKQKMDAFAQQAGAASYDSVHTLFGAVITQLEAKNARIKELEAARDKLASEKAAVDASFAQASQAHSAAQKQLSDQLNQVRNDLNAQINDKTNLVNTLQQNLRDKVQELATTKEAFTAEKKGLMNEMGKLQSQNTALVGKINLVQPPSVADGKVIAAQSNVPTAFIGLGRKDLLQPGTIFRIKNPNSDAVKAYAKVTRVEQERSEVELSGVVDPVGDQVRPGDHLYNDLYSPGVSRNILLMGRFSYPYNKPELENLLTALGNKVHTKMEPGVDLVILGNDSITEEGDGFQPITDTADYKEALNLGVEFAPLHKIRDLIRL